MRSAIKSIYENEMGIRQIVKSFKVGIDTVYLQLWKKECKANLQGKVMLYHNPK